MDGDATIRQHVSALYGPERADILCAEISALIASMPKSGAAGRYRFTAADTVLITYGNSLQCPGQPPLGTLAEFAARRLAAVFNTIHILPFFPFSSDDGFSVTDYARVDPALGGWDDVAVLGRGFRLMFDLVLNHVSAQSDWVRRYLGNDAAYADLAIAVDPQTDLSAVVRPRDLPLLTAFDRSDGHTVHLWTTFSADQVDLNWANPDVMLRMVALMLDYVQRGAAILRLDAVAYLWKIPGTACIHLPETHRLVKLLRAILDRAAPQVVLLTETNVPHAENISYFGDGGNEAQLVYNFTLPPLLLHTLAGADASALSRWAAGLKAPGPEATYLNFTASHDGIGVRPLEGVLPDAACARLVDRTRANQGKVSMRDLAGGKRVPYELNVTYIDALRQPGMPHDPLLADRFLASQSIQYALPGVPATYLPSLLGARNWLAGVRQTGRARSINRETFQISSLAKALDDPSDFRSAIFHRYCRLIRIRRCQPAFAPQASGQVLDLGRSVFGICRHSADQTLWAVTNVSPASCQVALPIADRSLVDLLDGTCRPARRIPLGPYQYRWLADSDCNR